MRAGRHVRAIGAKGSAAWSRARVVGGTEGLCDGTVGREKKDSFVLKCTSKGIFSKMILLNVAIYNHLIISERCHPSLTLERYFFLIRILHQKVLIRFHNPLFC